MRRSNNVRKRFFPTPELSSVAYWEQRAKQYGQRAVLNLGHSEQNFKAFTEQQQQEIFPYLKQSLLGDEKVVLDFGCGPGRFTVQLARLVNGKAIGVDIIGMFLQMVARYPSVDYIKIQEGTIPLADCTIDVIWCCLTLGGITNSTLLQQTVQEIHRILRMGGLLFLVENTTEKTDAHYWHFRTIEEYQALFPSIFLQHIHDYDDLGENISVMSGRKRHV